MSSTKLSFNIDKTKVIVIANDDYSHGHGFTQIRPARGNFEGIIEVLKNKKIIGIKEENIVELFNKKAADIHRKIKEIVSSHDDLELETLILYYVGHGYRADTSDNTPNKLYLTGIDSEINLIEDDGSTALDFDTVKRLLERSRIQQRIFILDACYSGIGTLSPSKFENINIDIDGTYVLASCPAYEKSYYDSNAQYTYFTEAFLRVLKLGMNEGDEYLDLDTIYTQIKLELYKTGKKLPEPTRKDNLRINSDQKHFSFAKNIKFNKNNLLSSDSGNEQKPPLIKEREYKMKPKIDTETGGRYAGYFNRNLGENIPIAEILIKHGKRIEFLPSEGSEDIRYSNIRMDNKFWWFKKISKSNLKSGVQNAIRTGKRFAPNIVCVIEGKFKFHEITLGIHNAVYFDASEKINQIIILTPNNGRYDKYEIQRAEVLDKSFMKKFFNKTREG